MQQEGGRRQRRSLQGWLEVVGCSIAHVEEEGQITHFAEDWEVVVVRAVSMLQLGPWPGPGMRSFWLQVADWQCPLAVQHLPWHCNKEERAESGCGAGVRGVGSGTSTAGIRKAQWEWFVDASSWILEHSHLLHTHLHWQRRSRCWVRP